MKIKYRIEDMFDKFIRRCQRFVKGYSNYDLWDIDWWFIDTMKRMLTEFRDKTCSYPADNECRSIEDWRYILSEMIECLDGMDIDKRTDECMIYDKKIKHISMISNKRN